MGDKQCMDCSCETPDAKRGTEVPESEQASPISVCAETEQREEKGEMVTASLERELAAGSVFNVLNLQGVCGRVDFKFPGD